MRNWRVEHQYMPQSDVASPLSNPLIHGILMHAGTFSRPGHSFASWHSMVPAALGPLSASWISMATSCGATLPCWWWSGPTESLALVRTDPVHPCTSPCRLPRVTLTCHKRNSETTPVASANLGSTGPKSTREWLSVGLPGSSSLALAVHREVLELNNKSGAKGSVRAGSARSVKPCCYLLECSRQLQGKHANLICSRSDGLCSSFRAARHAALLACSQS